MDEHCENTFFVLPEGRQFVMLEGTENCQEAPLSSRRVWFQRTATGKGTIYLFENRPSKRVTSGYSNQAFGWIAEWAAHNIWLPTTEGWCNFWSRHSFEATCIEGDGWWGDDHYIEFTDDTKWTWPNDMDEGTMTEHMRELGRVTNHRRQNRHWRTRAVVASAVLAAPYGAVDGSVNDSHQLSDKETDMAIFDPHIAAAQQQARLAAPASKQGTKVTNLKQVCGTALSTAVDNNKTAATSAAFLTAGKIANDQLVKQTSKHLPMMVRGYADTAVGKLVAANIAQLLIQHFKPQAKGANRLADAMVTQAYAELIATAGVEDFVDSFLNDPKIAKALKTVGEDDSAA